MFVCRSLLQTVERTINRPVLGVGVPKHHLQALMSRELLKGLDVCPYLSEPGDGGVTHGVRCNGLGIQARSLDTSGEGARHLLNVTAS
tara:strand:- start:137 stop:400 length:264 start_codon:yes stop_codon:yes gene_type:complete